MLLLAKTALSGWWQGPLLIALLFQIPLLQWCALGLLALVALRRGPSAGAIAFMATALVAGVFVNLVPNAGLPVMGLVSATVILGAAQVLRAFVKPVWSWFAVAVLLTAGYWSIHTFFPKLFSAYSEPARVMIEAWLSSLALEDRGDVAASAEALVVQIVVTLPLLLTTVGLLLGRYWQSKLFNPGGFAQEFQGSRVEAPLALFSIVLWLLFQFQGSSIFFGLANVFLLPFMLSGLGLFHWLARERHWGAAWYVAFYAVFIIIQMGVVLLAVVDAFVDVRWRLKRGIHGGSG